MAADLDQLLLSAIQCDNLADVQTHLNAGANPKCLFSEYCSALTLSASLGNSEIVRTLIDAGAEVNSPVDPVYYYERSWSPLMAAIIHENIQVIQDLIQANADILIYYNISPHHEELLIPDEIDSKLGSLDISCTPLYVAVAIENQTIIQLLLEANVSPDKGTLGDTPLNLAVRNQNHQIVQGLIEAGANVNIDLEDDWAIIMTAVMTGDLRIVKILVEAGAYIDLWSDGSSILNLAAKEGYWEIYEYLYFLANTEMREHAQTFTQQLAEKDLEIQELLRKLERLQTQPTAQIYASSNIELKSERGVDYSQLEELLQQQKWHQADEELEKRMLEVAGRQRSVLQDLDIKNFPCTDLRTINLLWVYYSEGKFGFGVQKQIWIDTGNPINGDVAVTDTFQKFAERVGWRKNKEYISYRRVIFDSSAPTGHLPFEPPPLDRAFYSFFMCRLAECDI